MGKYLLGALQHTARPRTVAGVQTAVQTAFPLIIVALCGNGELHKKWPGLILSVV
jgi:hypothetical protein